jgi:ribosomal protein S18 acetylase RimI-like enzyme
VSEIVEAARGRFVRLHLRTENAAAARLYERLGFLRRADVPHCSHVLDLSPRTGTGWS